MTEKNLLTFGMIFIVFFCISMVWYSLTADSPRAVWPHGDCRVSVIQSGTITSAWIDQEDESWRLFVAFRDGGIRRCSLSGTTLIRDDRAPGSATIVRVTSSGEFVYLTVSTPSPQYKTLYEAGWKNSPRRVKVTF